MMKKISGVMAAALVISMMTISVSADAVGFTLPKAAKAPVLDGKIERGEYTYAMNEGFGYNKEEAKGTPATVYAAYDDQNFYVACEVECKEHHCVVEGESYIFSKHHVMIAMTPTDPSEEQYKPKAGDKWEWSDAFNSRLGREFSLAVLEKDGSQISSIHFPSADSYTGNWKETVPNEAFKAVHVDGKDIYEVAVPWAYVDPDNKNPRTTGSKIGFALSIGLGDSTADDARFIQLGSGINFYKNFAEYGTVTLGETSKPGQVAGNAGSASDNAQQTGGVPWQTWAWIGGGVLLAAVLVLGGVWIVRHGKKTKGAAENS